MIACENSGHIIAVDFPEVRKIVSVGATSKPVKGYELALPFKLRQIIQSTFATAPIFWGFEFRKREKWDVI